MLNAYAEGTSANFMGILKKMFLLSADLHQGDIRTSASVVLNDIRADDRKGASL